LGAQIFPPPPENPGRRYTGPWGSKRAGPPGIMGAMLGHWVNVATGQRDNAYILEGATVTRGAGRGAPGPGYQSARGRNESPASSVPIFPVLICPSLIMGGHHHTMTKRHHGPQFD